VTLGLIAIAAALRAGDWYGEHHDRWGLSDDSSDFGHHDLGTFVIITAIAAIVSGGFAIIRSASRREDASAPFAGLVGLARGVATAMLVVSAVLATFFIAHRPHETFIGSAYPMFLAGAVLALVGLATARSADRA